MHKHEELFKLIKENPELPIVPMVDNELCGDDYSYYMGEWGNASLDEYLVTDERVYFKSGDYDELVEKVVEEQFEQFWDVHNPSYQHKPDEELNLMGKEIVDNNEWIKCITVKIGLL